MSMIYTLCFIQKADQLLMLNRNFAPNMGLWNGVGGKIKEGETPLAGVLREVLEETGIQLETIRFSGVVTWRKDQEESGMYVYIAKVPVGYDFPTPLSTEEGVLEWKDISWVINAKNFGVVSNIPIFLPLMLAEDERWLFTFNYENEHSFTYMVEVSEN